MLGEQVYVEKDAHIEVKCRRGNYSMIANRLAIVGMHGHDLTAVGCRHAISTGWR
jgi:hypothetical protein